MKWLNSRQSENYYCFAIINPLTADDHYIGHLIGRVCWRRSAFQRQNHENKVCGLRL